MKTVSEMNTGSAQGRQKMRLQDYNIYRFISIHRFFSVFSSRVFAIINVPSDLWFLCLTQIAEDGIGATDSQVINGSYTKSLVDI